jgi:peptidoglycan/LPS O-acetylase OafA/YrhL
MKKTSHQNYDAGIDVVRFLAFLFVFTHHFIFRGGNSISVNSQQFWSNSIVDRISFFGSEGVTVFFCLSGYLLSKLLLRELAETGNISVRSFYLRRILRIWPLYFSYILFCLLASEVLGNQAIKNSELPTLLTFTYNWHQIYVGESRGMPAILWSISVEEQIYLVLPLLLVLFSKWNVTRLALLLILIGYVSRFSMFINDTSAYRNTFCYMSTIGIGIFYAINEVKLKTWFYKNRSLLTFVFILSISLYILSFKSIFSEGYLNIFAFDLTAFLTLFLLLMLSGIQNQSHNKLLWPFAWLGRRTYGMYVYHWPVLAFMVSRDIFFKESQGISLLGILFAFVLVVSISAFSYRFFEKPFLNLRKKYQYVKVG